MITQKRLQIETIIKMAVIIICASLYAWGGMEEKWLRRFLAPSICGGFIALYSRDWRATVKTPLLIVSSALGYGADEFWIKVVKRFYVGLAFGLSASSYELIKAILGEKKQWLIFGFSLVLLVSAYILFGVFNPLNARMEESILGLFIYTMAIMPVNRR